MCAVSTYPPPPPASIHTHLVRHIVDCQHALGGCVCAVRLKLGLEENGDQRGVVVICNESDILAVGAVRAVCWERGAVSQLLVCLKGHRISCGVGGVYQRGQLHVVDWA